MDDYEPKISEVCMKLRADVARLTLELDEAGSNCSMYKQQVLNAIAREAKLRELWEAVEKEYFARLKEQDEEAAKFEAEKDMYGWNFHKGLRGGLVEFHIYMTKMVKALALPADDSALQERLKQERDKTADLFATSADASGEHGIAHWIRNRYQQLRNAK